MKKNRILSFLLIFIMMITFSFSNITHAATSEDDENVVTVAFPQLYGYSETNDDGTRTGVIVDYLNEIAKYTNWKYEFLDVTVEEIPELFAAGKIDLLGSMFYENAPSKALAYPKYTIGSQKLVLLARADNDALKSYDLSTLNGKTIGVNEASVEEIKYLESFLNMNNINCQLKYYSPSDYLGDERLLPYLDAGHIDLLLKSNRLISNDHKVIAIFDSQPYYLVTSPSKPEILKGLNMALEKIYSSNLTYADDCYYRNFVEAAYFNVYMTADERKYVEAKKTVTVAFPTSLHPICCINTTEQPHNGIAIDILDKIAEYSGFEFTYVFAESYEESVQLVKDGKADMLGYFSGSEKTASDSSLVLSAPYAGINEILMENAKQSFNRNHAVFSIKDITFTDSDLTAADYSDICFAFSRPADINLLSIINKAINNIDDETLNNIISHNMYIVSTGPVSLSTLLYSQPIMFFSIIILIVALFLILVLTISHSKIRAQTMQADLNRANAASQAKSEFLSRMSHEIRTPMNAIIGLTDLVTHTHNLPKDVQDNLDKIHSSSRFLLNLINDILDMSKIESGKLEVGHEPFSMKKMLEAVNNMTAPESKRKNITYTTDIILKHDIFVGDELRIKQILMNLLANACKFTPEGGAIRLTINEGSYSAESALLYFSVKDTGIGIATEDHQRIFELFEQVGDSNSKLLGSGLGLPICSNLVKIMNGTLELKSAPGEGSEFFFSLVLPYGEMPEDEPSNHNENILSGMHILLVEDNDLNAEVATKLLELQDAKITRVENGKEAVDTFNTSALGTFNAILMDIRMPVMNGLDATKAIRALEHKDAQTIPIIAMTANSFGEDCDAATQAGMTDYLSKPINLKQLYSVLLNCR